MAITPRALGPTTAKVPLALVGDHLVRGPMFPKEVGAVCTVHRGEGVLLVVAVGDHLRGVIIRHVSADMTLGIIRLGRRRPSRAVELAVILRHLGWRRRRRIAATVRGAIVVGGLDTHWRGWCAEGEGLSCVGNLVSARTGAMRTRAVGSRRLFVVCAGGSGVGRVELVVAFVPVLLTFCLRRAVLVASVSGRFALVVEGA